MENGEQDVSSKSPGMRSDLSNSYIKGASPNRGSINHSMARSSFITEKSFRVPGGRHKISKKEAAVIIQKNYRRYRHREDFKMVVRRVKHKKFLFKTTLHSNDGKIKFLTCSLGVSNRGKLLNLTFEISNSVRSSSPIGREKISIDISVYEI